MNTDIIIQPFKEKGHEREDKINKTIKEPLTKLNQHVLVASPTGAGKTTICLNLLMKYYKYKFDRIIFFSKTWDYDLYKDYIQVDDDNVYRDFSYQALNQIIDEQKAIQTEKKKKIFTLIVFDDFQDLFSRGSILEQFLCHCRHWNITCWVLAQYVKAISKLARQQFTGFLCFPNLANQEDLDIIAETAPLGKQVFKKACQLVNEKIGDDKNIRHFLWINKKLPQKYYLDFNHPLNVG